MPCPLILSPSRPLTLDYAARHRHLRIKTVEKVLALPTFVMKGDNKVYLFRLPNPDEVMMRTWIAAISQELKGK